MFSLNVTENVSDICYTTKRSVIILPIVYEEAYLTYELYIDVFWCMNFGMDLIDLLAVNQILRCGASWKRLIVMSAVGALLSTMAFLILNQAWGYKLMVQFLINPCMLWNAYRPKKLRRFLWEWGSCYAVMLLEGGIVQWQLLHTAWGGNIGMLWAGTALGMTLLLGGWNCYRYRQAEVLTVQLCHGGHTLQIQAFYDTGNHLMDPYVGKPVQIVSETCLKELGESVTERVRYIPFSALGTEHGILKAVTLEKMYFYYKGEKRQVAPVVVGVAPPAIFQGKDYAMLINAKTLE